MSSDHWRKIAHELTAELKEMEAELERTRRRLEEALEQIQDLEGELRALGEHITDHTPT